MNILIFGAGVIGATYGWQLAQAGHAVTLLVRKGKKAAIDAAGIDIHCKDERVKGTHSIDFVFRPAVVEELAAESRFDLILVCVKSNQLEAVLPSLAERAGSADILFFQNNWWGDEKIKAFLPASQYLFGFSRLVGGWRAGDKVECLIFDAPGMGTMLGERDGRLTPRLKKIEGMMREAGLKPELSPDILSWLKFHYVEYLSATGAILQAGSTKKFADDASLVKDAIVATREGLAVCRARGVNFKAAPGNLKMFGLPLFLLVPLAQYQYRMPNIQQFFDENVAHGVEEIAQQYRDVIGEGKRLGVPMPCLSKYDTAYRRR